MIDKDKIIEAINFLRKDGAFEKALKIENDINKTTDEKLQAIIALALEEAAKHNLIKFTEQYLGIEKKNRRK